MPSGAEGLRHGAIRGLHPRHALLPWARGPMRERAPVLARPTLARRSPWEPLARGRAVARHLGCYDGVGPDGKLWRSWRHNCMAAGIWHRLGPRLSTPMLVLVDRAPQVRVLAMDRQADRVHMPWLPRARPSALQLRGVRMPTLPTPLADGRVGHSEAVRAHAGWAGGSTTCPS
jgi:hypothetical protein